MLLSSAAMYSRLMDYNFFKETTPALRRPHTINHTDNLLLCRNWYKSHKSKHKQFVFYLFANKPFACYACSFIVPSHRIAILSTYFICYQCNVYP